jgi:hypothetical protein
MSNTARIALDYLEQHSPIGGDEPSTRYLFPLGAGRKGKPKIKDNLNLATNDPAQIEQWAEQYDGCWWGCACKKSGVVCVDIDMKPGQNGAAAVRALVAQGFTFPRTETQRSSSNGVHKIYEGEHHFSAGKIGKDVLGEGVPSNIDTPNYFVIAGCTRPDGKGYSIDQRLTGSIVRLPEWIAQAIKPRSKERTATTGEPIDLECFVKALQATPYRGGPPGLDDRHGYGGWLGFMFACHEAAAGDETVYLSAFIDWSLDDPAGKDSWTAESIERHWQSANADPDPQYSAITRQSWFKVLSHFGRGDIIHAITAAGDMRAFAEDPVTDDRIAAATAPSTNPETVAAIEKWWAGKKPLRGAVRIDGKLYIKRTRNGKRLYEVVK